MEDGFTQAEISAAQTKTYTTAAVIVLVLYFVLWLPGLIANLMYYNEAKYMEDIAGYPAPGVGVLKMELILLGVLPFVAAIVFVIASLVAVR